MSQATSSNTIHLTNTNIKLHYLESGSQQPQEEVILLIHGWPTSSYLYRQMMQPLGACYRTIAIDLPGFGKSDKNLNASFSFKYYAKIIQEFIDQLHIQKVHLVVHDLGGPIGLWWAQQHRDIVVSYVILDTIIFPDFSWAVKLFGLSTKMPILNSWLSSPNGVAKAMKFGVYNKAVLSSQILAGYQAPYTDSKDGKAAQEILLLCIHRLHPNGFKDLANGIKEISVPTCLIYAENDRVLPKAEDTVRRVAALVPQAEINSIPECGHFLQEEKPEAVAKIMVDFYKKNK